MAHLLELDDNWDDVRYVEHEGGEDWAQAHKHSGKSEFAKRLRAEAKASNRAARRFEQRFKSSHLKASPHAPPAAQVEEETANDVLRNLAFEDLEEQPAEVHTPETQPPTATAVRTPLSRSDPRPKKAPRTPQQPAVATPTLCSELMADRPSHWKSCPKHSRTPAPIRATPPFQTPDARISKQRKAHTDLVPTSLSTLKKRKRMPPSQGMSFRPSWLSQPRPTAVEEVVDDCDDGFDATCYDGAEAQQPLLQHAAAPGGTPQANRRRGGRRGGGELEAKLSKIRARLARDHAAFRSGSADPSASTVLDVIHPRSRAKYAVDVTIMDIPPSSCTATSGLSRSVLGARDLVELVAFVHRAFALKSSRNADAQDEQSWLQRCQVDGVHVNVLMAANDVRRHAIRPGSQLRFYDCVIHPAPAATGSGDGRPLMLCTTLFEAYREEFGILSEPVQLEA